MRAAAKRFASAATILIAAALLPAPAGAEPAAAAPSGMYSRPAAPNHRDFEKLLGDPSPIAMERLLPALLYAISRLSKYPVPEQMPVLHRVPREKLEEMTCIGKCAVLANYKPGDGIYLADELEPESNIFARSVLLHELVHYVQDLVNDRGNLEDCLRWYYREVEAYGIQRRFLLRIGSPIRVGYLPERTACNEELKSKPTATLYDD